MQTNAESLKANRIAMGLTRKQLADLIGVSHYSVRNWENGTRKIPKYASNVINGLKSTKDICSI